jgi:hypothetical protein
MTLDRSYIGYLGFLDIDLFKSVLMYSEGTICLSRLLFKMGLFTVQYRHGTHSVTTCEFSTAQEPSYMNDFTPDPFRIS